VSSNRTDRILLHVQDSRRLLIEAEDISYLEAAGQETVVRRHGRRTLRDVRLPLVS